MALTRRAICGLALLGAAVALIAAARHAPPFREVSDGAILEIYTLQALKGKLLVGPYSRFGWHHPGPLYFYLESPWYWFSGFHTAGMQAGAIAINVAALAGLAFAAMTLGSSALSAAILAATAFYVLRTADLVASPWNPHVIVLPLLAFVLLVAGMVPARRGTLLVALVLVGSFLAQTHVAMAPLVGALGGLAAIDAFRARKTPSGVLSRRSVVAAAALAIVLWLPTFVEQATHRPGNLTRLAAFFIANGPGRPFAGAATAWAAALTAPFRSDFAIAVGVPLRLPHSPWPMLGALAEMAGLAGAAWWFRRRGDGFGARLAAMNLAASLAGLAAASRIAGEILDHELFWLSALGVLNVGILAAVPFDAAVGRRRTGARAAARSAALVLLGAAVFTAAAAMRHVLQRPRTIDDHSVDVVVDEFARETSAAGIRRPLVRIEHPVWPIAAGALLEIAKGHRSFAVADPWPSMYGEAFAATGREDGIVAIEGSPAAPRVTVSPLRPRP